MQAVWCSHKKKRKKEKALRQNSKLTFKEILYLNITKDWGLIYSTSAAIWKVRLNTLLECPPLSLLCSIHLPELQAMCKASEPLHEAIWKSSLCTSLCSGLHLRDGFLSLCFPTPGTPQPLKSRRCLSSEAVGPGSPASPNSGDSISWHVRPRSSSLVFFSPPAAIPHL